MAHWLLRYDLFTRWLLWAPLFLLVFVLALIIVHFVDKDARKWAWKGLAGIAAFMFVVHAYLSLSWAPPEQYMGDTGRILYIHVPLVAEAMLALTLNFVCSVAYLFKKSFFTDALAEASVEVGMLYGSVGVLLGSIWAKPTWGTWWTWDPRLTTAAILLVVYVGYMATRKFVEDPEKRATWSAVMGIFAAVDIPVTYLSVKWWKSMHQAQSNPSTVDPQMVMVLRWGYIMALALLFVLIYQRFLVAQATRNKEVALPSSLPDAQEA
jgi:heme exporter protein C